MRKITIAIDGVSSGGKSTIAREIASQLGYVYVDTGAMYRALTLYGLRKGYINGNDFFERLLIADLDKIKISFAENGHVLLGGEDVEKEIREMMVSDKVSLTASLPEVRSFLVIQQRELGKGGGVVMDGRDIGTVVFPEAELKLYVTSLPEVRAKRRYKELKEKGLDVNYEDVLKNITERDRIDSTRAVSPLTQAPDAVLLDNSAMDRKEQLDFVKNLVRKTLAKNAKN